MIIWILLLFNQIVSAQSIVCGQSSCVPNNLSAIVQEKATHSAIDLGFNSGDITVLSGTGTSTREVRLSMSNGEFPGKNLNIDLSSNSVNKSSGDIIVFADNINLLNVKLNGYNGSKGLDGSEICATRVVSGLYGNDIKQRFLQRRAGSNLSMTKCVADDITDIQANTFSCADASYVSLDRNDPKINLTRVRKISKCQSVLPQNVCLQKSYQISCNYRLQLTQKVIEGSVQGSALSNYGANGDKVFFDDLMDRLKYSYQISCSQNETCPSFPLCYNRATVTKNGSTVLDNYYTHYESDMWTSYNSFKTNSSSFFNLSKVYQRNQAEFDQLNNDSIQSGVDVCQKLIENDPAYSHLLNSYTVTLTNQGKIANDRDSCRYDDQNMRRKVYNDSSQVKWVSTTTPQITETSPGLDSTGLRLSGGSAFLALFTNPLDNNAMQQDNLSNWKLQLMPAHFPSCNQSFTKIGTETTNVIKSLFDPNLFNSNSAYCLNVNDPTNCSAPPHCDNPADSTNCRKVSICEQINKKYCLDPNNPTNCSSPPFCDDPTSSTNCSTSALSKSCDPADPTNSFCDKDPNNLGSYQYIGAEPDPSKLTESADCRVSNCNAQYRVVESSQSLDTIQPTNGENGTSQGRGLFFVYDIKTIQQSQANAGQAGDGGRNDIQIPTETRYCAIKRDFTTDPNTKYENDPEVIFKKINWKSLDIQSGGTPGTYPNYSDKSIEIFKKIDPGVRYLLKKELL